MATKVVNLNRFRKKKRAEERTKQAAENRAKHGRTQAQKDREHTDRERAARALEGKRLETAVEAGDFEGTLVLERLAAIDRVDDFFDAIDSDDVERTTALMKKAKLDAATIAIVVRKMEDADGDH